MSHTAAVTGSKQTFSFVNVFTNNPKSTETPQQTREENVRLALTQWLNATGYISTIHSTTLSAGQLFRNGRVIVTFSLTEAYRNTFPLFRGLLEFSRPREISISINSLDRTFQLQVSEEQIESIKNYLGTILSSLVKEIRFKTSLRAVIDFENTVRQEQLKLYEALRASL